MKGQRCSSVAEYLCSMYGALGFLFVFETASNYVTLACVYLQGPGIGRHHHAWLNNLFFFNSFLKITVLKFRFHINIRKKRSCLAYEQNVWCERWGWGVNHFYFFHVGGLTTLFFYQINLLCPGCLLCVLVCFALLQFMFSLTTA